MDIQSAIRAVTEHRDLSGEEMTSVMHTIMGGEATASQIGGFLIGLRMKGESVEEIAAAATVMRELALPVQVQAEYLVDTCGTGGDGSSTFNISTASAFVAAGAGAAVAKHGNRSASSSSGSADVLEAAGVNLDLTPEQVARCIQEAGVGFMFAPKHHGAMKHAIGPRKEMAVRTIFNVLGPLTNPAGAPNQVVGVFSLDLIEPLARVLARLGSRHVLVVHAEDGLDEISIGSDTHVAEFRDGSIHIHRIHPEQFGMESAELSSLTVSSPEESLETIQAIFDNNDGPARDIVALNAGAAIYASGLAADLTAGVEAAITSLSSGAARERLAKLVALSNSF
jgi:anthranilate phosphoribosyltransferase